MASELGVQTIQHTNGTDALTIDSSGQLTVSNLDYLGVVFPSATSQATGSVDSTGDLYQNIANNLSVSSFDAGEDTGEYFVNYTHHTISGFSNGVYEFNLHMSMDRTSNASEIQLAVALYEGTTRIVHNFSEGFTQGYTSASLSVIRDYTTTIPTSVKLYFESNKSNYLVAKGCGYTIKRIA